ncbi:MULTISPECIES: hypothetical protein [unclassified Acinetobacter]|uniref:hypothetical protein n=1 Tax=unclassified Acinetobacter TaxID=196816 RepID=UPI001C22B380|nr:MULTISPECIES: hypothetical protein [unclassified Acinetobacter]
MKNLGILIFIAILAGCSYQEFNEQKPDPNVLIEQQLKSARAITKKFLLNPDSAKFRNQIRDCGEVSYKKEGGNITNAFQRFIVLDKNIVLLENGIDQTQFELSWKSACTPSWM